MSQINLIDLDVLKPHDPNILEFATQIGRIGEDYTVQIDVVAVDEKTESVLISIEANNIDYDAVVAVINKLGGSIHSIDRVRVLGSDSFEHPASV